MRLIETIKGLKMVTVDLDSSSTILLEIFKKIGWDSEFSLRDIQTYLTKSPNTISHNLINMARRNLLLTRKIKGKRYYIMPVKNKMNQPSKAANKIQEILKRKPTPIKDDWS